MPYKLEQHYNKKKNPCKTNIKTGILDAPKNTNLHQDCTNLGAKGANDILGIIADINEKNNKQVIKISALT